MESKIILWYNKGADIQEKDITQKMLERHNDVFSDIVNVLLFGGKKVVAE